jgi:hypothetical protein
MLYRNQWLLCTSEAKPGGGSHRCRAGDGTGGHPFFRSGTVDVSKAMIPWEKYMDNMCKYMGKTCTQSMNMDTMCKYMGDVFHVFPG